MVFLILSNRYPEDSQRRRYLREAGPRAGQVSPFHRPLAASADDGQWRTVLDAVRRGCHDGDVAEEGDDDPSGSAPSSVLDDTSRPRPLRPNDDNYRAFAGPRWRPESDVDESTTVPPVMAALLSSRDDPSTVYPRYDRCARCTGPATLRCSRCKIVRYCGRDPCQSAHWREVHRSSCIPAPTDVSLWRCLHGSDGFYVTPEECTALQDALSRAVPVVVSTTRDGELIRCFQVYFRIVSDLGGCFVL